ncbi:porin [Rhizobium sp. FKL33]|uniref:porin n=1 Tax=Rhizobium sp. FKL33 TaxID=2562307 RepID=UPI0010C08E73|nr:porin [Rhizobium sp. FKL33]
MKMIAVGLFLLAIVSPPALAEDAVTADPSTPSQPQGNPCSAYGEGYIAVDGGKTCIRVGGRIRYDIGVGEDETPRKD